MATMTVRCLDAWGSHALGEGPLWDERNERLWWVDISAKRIRWAALDGPAHSFELDQEVSALGLTDDPETLIAGLRDGIARVHPASGCVTFLAKPTGEAPGTRFNEGKCGPSGRFWCGTMTAGAKEPTGHLYCLAPHGTLEPRVSGVRCSNGLAWTADRSTLYYIDTPTRRIDAFDYDDASAALHNRRTIFDFSGHDGAPDGMTIDGSDHLWVALWGGWSVVRMDPATATLLDRVPIDAANVTSCVFGGPALETLYVTTASGGPDQRDGRPSHPGHLFEVHGLDATGLPAFRFGPG